MTSEAPGTSGQEFYADVADDKFFNDRHIHNISVQTGEEFSPEFLRYRIATRRVVPVINDRDQCQVINDRDQRQEKRVLFNVDQNHPAVYEDLTNILGLRKDSKCGSEASDFKHGIGYSQEMENKGYSDRASRYHRNYSLSKQGSSKFLDESYHNRGPIEAAPPALYVPEATYSYKSCDSANSDGSFTGKIKFLCSFGGRILPRPNDGKLRYVGGETRIMSIRKSLAFDELSKKTSAVCSQPHTIKYQLPGEDLDALISVSSDEDLHHMVEEYHELERVVGPQRLRLFLISSGESESSSSIEGRGDADYNYVVAVNGMDPSPRKGSSGQSSSSQFGNSLENSLSFRRKHPNLEIKVGPNSSNLGGMFSNPAMQFLTPTQTSFRPYIQSPPLSPVLVQYRDPSSSPRQFYEDHTFHDGHEMINPLVNSRVAYDNNYCVDTRSFYHNHPRGLVPSVNYHPQSRHVVDADWKNKHADMNFYNCYPNKEYTLSPRNGPSDIETDRQMPKERAFLSEKIISHPEDLLSKNSNVSQHRISHALSDSKLQEHEERSNYIFQEGLAPSTSLNFEPAKLSSPKSPSFVQEISMKPQEIVDEKCHVPRYENHPSVDPHEQYQINFLPSQEEIKWNSDRDAIQLAKHYEGNISISSEGNNVPNVISPVSMEVSILARERTPTSPIVFLESLDIVREHDHDHQLDQATPGFHFQGQNLRMDDQLKLVESNSGLVVDQSSKGPRLHKSEPLIVNPGVQNVTNYTSKDHVVSLDDNISINLQNPKEVQKLESCIFIQSPPLEKCDNNNAIEPVLIVEDVTNNVPSGICSSSTVAPHVQHDGIGDAVCPGAAEMGSIPPESYLEDEKGGGGDVKDSISDATIAEIEAGIYGLQIIKDVDLEELKELGSGTFGTVYHGKWRGSDVAIKRIKKSCFAGKPSEQERLTKDFWREAQILSKLHHPNVVAFYGVVPDGPGGTLATVTEYMVNGSLRHVLLRKDRALDRRKKLIIAMDAAFGMEYLHMKNIVHFDLKCDNLLVNLRDPQRPICKVGDFGLSRIKRNTLVSGGVRGTLPWMAPELLSGSSNQVSEKVDVFSFGVAMWEILTGEEPYASMHCGAIIGGIVNNTLRPAIPERCDAEWKNLMEECWSPEPAARPSFTEITNRLRVMSKALHAKRFNRTNR